MLVNDTLTGLERVTISAARMYAVESSAVIVPGPANGRRVEAPSVPASDVVSRLGLRDGQAVALSGRADDRIVDALLRAYGVRIASRPEDAEVIMYWPASVEALHSDLPTLVERLRPESHLWIVAGNQGRTGVAKLPVIPQSEVVAAARRAGLVDNRVAFLSDREFGYRFQRDDGTNPAAH
jgi:hypothetical protein